MAVSQEKNSQSLTLQNQCITILFSFMVKQLILLSSIVKILILITQIQTIQTISILLTAFDSLYSATYRAAKNQNVSYKW